MGRRGIGVPEDLRRELVCVDGLDFGFGRKAKEQPNSCRVKLTAVPTRGHSIVTICQPRFHCETYNYEGRV